MNETKPCASGACPNEILADAEFTLCEVCRILKLRELIALGQSPDQYSAPLALRKQNHHQTVELMRQDEMVVWLANLEFNYLETQKVMKLYGIGNEKKKAFKSLAEQIEETRDCVEAVSIRAKQNKKREVKKKSNIEKLATRMGISEDKAKEWMEEDINL